MNLLDTGRGEAAIATQEDDKCEARLEQSSFIERIVRDNFAFGTNKWSNRTNGKSAPAVRASGRLPSYCFIRQVESAMSLINPSKACDFLLISKGVLLSGISWLSTVPGILWLVVSSTANGNRFKPCVVVPAPTPAYLFGSRWIQVGSKPNLSSFREALSAHMLPWQLLLQPSSRAAQIPV